ncbi:MAG TPA: hypothetical protein VMK12_08725 [Anaeromyxobacteraceae bacterium]|nr:hypothetical protein [Anaeromyxobacteraceae bacterium]
MSSRMKSLLLAVAMLLCVGAAGRAQAQAKPQSAPLNPIPEVVHPGVQPKRPAVAPTAGPSVPFNVQLSANVHFLEPGVHGILTATTDAEVGGAGFSITIFDVSSKPVQVASCPSGISCRASVSSSGEACHTFVAHVSRPDGSSIQATSNNVDLLWTEKRFEPTLSVAPSTTVHPGTSVTLTTTTHDDIGPTPFWMQIFDLATSTQIALCGFGTSCEATSTSSRPGAALETEQFAAVLACGTSTQPLDGDLMGDNAEGIGGNESTAFVTWSTSPVQVSLSLSADGLSVVARTSAPYGGWISIYRADTGELLSRCFGSSSCAWAFDLSNANLVAFLTGGAYPTILPPLSQVEASSPVQFFLGPR